jgi:uncharacterized membrane protein
MMGCNHKGMGRPMTSRRSDVADDSAIEDQGDRPTRPPEPGTDDDDLDNGRIISLSDGVFAFAMTLMVLQFDTPDPERVSPGALRAYILDQWPSLLSYTITFGVIANYWVIHHRTFRYIRTHDTALMWINILFLLCISFLPFPTDVLGDYHETAFAVQFYGLAMAVTSAMLTGLWLYLARQRRLLHDSCDELTVRYQIYRGAATCAVFLLSVATTLLDVRIAWVCWTLLFPAHRLLARSYRTHQAGAAGA